MEVAEKCDVSLELPRVLIDAVVELEAPMKAAAAPSNANAMTGSKSTDSSTTFGIETRRLIFSTLSSMRTI